MDNELAKELIKEIRSLRTSINDIYDQNEELVEISKNIKDVERSIVELTTYFYNFG